jgi:PKD repeat protein
MKNRLSLSVFLVMTVFLIKAQSIEQDSIQRTAKIVHTINGNKVSFNPETPPLSQIAGAPKAFYTYYWEFDDGNYSFQKEPKHSYKKKGNYKVKLSVTNNYDDGKPPLTRPVEVAINEETFDTSENEKHHLLSAHNGFRLQTNREPVPNEELQFILSYGNEKTYPTNGKIYLFYNEKKYKNKNFELTDTRLYHNEQELSSEVVTAIPSLKSIENITGIKDFISNEITKNDSIKINLPLTVEEAKAYYHDYKIFDFENLKSNDSRNMFFTFKTTPEMLKDTSAIITIRSIYVPERGKDEHQVRTKEMEIVTSHDPNKMAVYDTRLNYRLVRFKRLKYKVRFQNDGEGPAKLIKLNVDIPEMLDKTSLKVLDMYPKCPICPDGKEVRYSCLDTIINKDLISFQFKNIYLPGTAQKGVYDKDSTKGFVKYSLKFGKNFHKKPSKSKTAIIFDKNDPIVTNTSTSRFSPGISIGVKSGYNSFPDLTDSKSYFVGATISPYKSFRKYLQAEVMIGTHEFANFSSISEPIGFVELPNGEIVDSAIRLDEVNSEHTKLNIDVVPISFRYNLNGIIGIGVGPQLSFDVSNKIESNVSSDFYTYYNNEIGKQIGGLRTQSITSVKDSFTDIKMGVFADITLGAARIGPSVGFRYVYNFEEPHAQYHFYAIWKI